MATFLKPQNFSQTLFLWKDRFVTYVNTFSNHLENSLADIDAMDRRLRARLSYIEFAGLVLGCAMIAIFVYLMRIKAGGPVDFSRIQRCRPRVVQDRRRKGVDRRGARRPHRRRV